jgi:geranylgeranyl pyrophosphate synthase
LENIEMPNEPLADPKLEAAANILATIESHLGIAYTRRWSSRNGENAKAMLSTAIRETKAQELAEALEKLIDTFGNPASTERVNAMMHSAIVLASFKELTNAKIS